MTNCVIGLLGIHGRLCSLQQALRGILRPLQGMSGGLYQRLELTMERIQAREVMCRRQDIAVERSL